MNLESVFKPITLLNWTLTNKMVPVSKITQYLKLLTGGGIHVTHLTHICIS